MDKRRMILTSALIAILAISFPAFVKADGPFFGPAIYADGVAWGTKGLGELPPPNEHNVQSFDKLFIITNGAEGQLAVSEAGPGNPYYNGGRWWAQTVEWNEDGFDYYGDVPVLTSYMDIMDNYDDGFLDITPGHPDPDHATYFLCPLLPVK